MPASCCVYGVAIRGGGAIGMMKGKLIAAALTFIVAAWSMRALLTARFQWRFVRETLSFSLPLVPHLAMASGLIVADRFILQHYRNLSEVGIYSLAYTLGMVMYLVTQSLPGLDSDVLRIGAQQGRESPAIGSYLLGIGGHSRCPRMFRYSAFAVVRTRCSRLPLSRSRTIVPLVVMGYLFHSLFSLFSLSILQVKRTPFVFAISVMAFSANLALNFAMIPRWGMYGAAWVSTIAYAIEALGRVYIGQRFFALSYRVSEILAGFAVAGGALWLTQLPWMQRWQGLLLVVSAAVTLGLVALIGRRDLQRAIIAIRNARNACQMSPVETSISSSQRFTVARSGTTVR